MALSSSSSSSSSSSYYYYYYSEDGEEGSGSGWGSGWWPPGNGSGCGWAASDWEASFWLLPALYVLVFVLGLAGNGLVLATACCPRRPRRPSSAWASGGAPPWWRRRAGEAYLAHLALADLAFVVTLPLWAAYTALGFHWPFGAALCKASSYLVLLNMFASAFCLAALSLERYRALVRHAALPPPVASPAFASSSSSSSASASSAWPRRAALGALWLAAALLALPALLLRDTRPADPHDAASSPALSCELDLSGVASGPAEEAAWLAGLSLASTALGFVLPLLLMSLCYLAIGAALSRHFRAAPGPSGRRRRGRLLRILASLVGVFAGCWLPFHLLKSLYVLAWLGLLRLPCAARALLLRLHPYATCLAYLNSCLNPLLYAALDPRFRAHARHLLRPLLFLAPRPRDPPAPPASASASASAWACLPRCRPPPSSPSSSSTLSGQTHKSEAPSLGTKL